MKEKIPVLYTIDLTYDRPPDVDVFEMFLASLFGLVHESSSPLEIVVVSVGWQAWQYEAAQKAVYKDDCSIRFVNENNYLYEKLMKSMASIGTTTQWSRIILYKLGIKEIFKGKRYAFSVDFDVMFRPGGDIALALEQSKKLMAGDKYLFAGVPDSAASYCAATGQYYAMTMIPYLNVGFICFDLSNVPDVEEFAKYHAEKIKKGDIKGYGGCTEQDLLNFFAHDNGVKTACYDPSFCSMASFDYPAINDSHVKDLYNSFGVERPDGFKWKKECLSAKITHLVNLKPYVYDESHWLHSVYEPLACVSRKIISTVKYSYPPLYKKFAVQTDVQHYHTPNKPFWERRPVRPIVMSNAGSERWRDYLLPSVLSVVLHAKNPYFFVITYNKDTGPTAKEKLDLEKILRISGIRHYVDFREVDLDLSIFSKNKWADVNLHKLFASKILPDIDEYCLFLDTDVMVFDDLEPLFGICDMQPDIDKVVGFQNHFAFTNDGFCSPVQMGGGFLFMHPNGIPARYACKRLFTEHWHENDEYVIGQVTRKEDFVEIGNACIESLTEGNHSGKVRRDAMEKAGLISTRNFAIHFHSNSGNDRFNRRKMLPEHGHFVDEWDALKMMTRMITK